MVSDKRREFLKFAAASAGAAATLSLLPQTIRDALAVPAARVTGTIQDVQHVVILMQENRSFDHYFGALRGVRGFDDPRPIPLPGGRSVWHQPIVRGAENFVLPYHLDAENTAALCMHDVDHRWKGSHALWKDYDAWMEVKGERCMGYFTRADLPFYYALADAFTVCDAYYCSHHGPTNPNRMHLFTGTSGMTVGDYGPQAVNNADDGNWKSDMALDDPAFPGHAWTTYAERLHAAGISWRVYQEYDNYGDNSLAYFANFRNLDTDSEFYRRARAWVPGTDAGNWEQSRGETLVAAFEQDIRQGTLPQVSWIVGPEIMTEHPGTEVTPGYGQSLVSRLLGALAAKPEVWAKTVFIINYDENGGFFDHVAPPLPPIERNMGLSTVDTSTEDYFGVPVGLGVRTPMFVVSPWSKGGWVDSQVFDHTSVLRFLEARFGVEEPNISAWRRAVAGDLTSALDFDRPNAAWPPLPDTSDYIDEEQSAACLLLPQPTAPADPQPPRQERGLRRARALPYRLRVHGRIDAEAGQYWLDFGNEGEAGAGLNVYAGNRSDGPWYYTVESGTELSDYWSAAAVTAGIYDLSVYGPNGFLRQFQGDLSLATAGADPEVQASCDLRRNRLVLHLHNGGSAACRITLRANHYSRRGPQS